MKASATLASFAARSARPSGLTLAAWLMMMSALGAARAEDKPVYRCPGNLYTDALTVKEAIAKGCKTLEGAPITVIQAPAARPASRVGSASSGGGGEKVGADDQRARDADARRILEAELKKEEEALTALQKEYNSGQPERQGDERNFQKYMDRVAALKASVTRKEADVAALRRELGKFGASK